MRWKHMLGLPTFYQNHHFPPRGHVEIWEFRTFPLGFTNWTYFLGFVPQFFLSAMVELVWDHLDTMSPFKQVRKHLVRSPFTLNLGDKGKSHTLLNRLHGVLMHMT